MRFSKKATKRYVKDNALKFWSKERKKNISNLADELAGDDWHIKNRSSFMFFERFPLHAIALLDQSYNICEILPQQSSQGILKSK